MPRRKRNTSTEGKKPRLLFTESPVNIVHCVPSPALASDHPATADVVSVNDSNVTWVSPHFEGAQSSHDHPKRKRLSRHPSGTASNYTTRSRRSHMTGNTTPGKSRGAQRQAANFNSLQFVNEDPQVVEDPSSDDDLTCEDVPQPIAESHSRSPTESPCVPKSKRLTAKKVKQKKKVSKAVFNLNFSESEDEALENSQCDETGRSKQTDPHTNSRDSDSDPIDYVPTTKKLEDRKNKKALHHSVLQVNNLNNGNPCDTTTDSKEVASLESMLNTTKQMNKHKARVNSPSPDTSVTVSTELRSTSPSLMDSTGVRPVSSRRGKPPSRRLFRLGYVQETSPEGTSNSDTDKENLRQRAMRGRRDMGGKRLYPNSPTTSVESGLSKTDKPNASIRYQTPPNQKHCVSPCGQLKEVTFPQDSEDLINTPRRRSMRIKQLRERAFMFFNAPVQSSEAVCCDGRPPLVYDTPEEDYGLPVRLRRIKYRKLKKLEFL